MVWRMEVAKETVVIGRDGDGKGTEIAEGRWR